MFIDREMDLWTVHDDANLVPQFLIGILVLSASVWLGRYLIRLAQLPPGPWGLPIIGYAPWIGRNPHQTLAKLGKKYGGLFSINLGGETMVVLGDWPSIKASLVDQAKNFDGRMKYHFLLQLLTKRKNVGFNDGPVWIKHRKLVVKCLRSIGMGKKSMEGLIMEAVYHMIHTLTQFDGKNIEMDTLFFKPMLKINWKLVARHSFEEKELDNFEKDICTIFKSLRSDNPILIFPWLRFLPPNGFGFDDLQKASNHVKAHFNKLIEGHKSRLKEDMDADFIDHYLDAIKAQEVDSKITNPPYDVDHLMGALLDLFTAGVETTNSTCLWGFLYLAYHPQVQSRLQNELDSVVGRHRLPNLDDLPRLPYLEATVMEIHRHASVVSLSGPHRATRNSRIFNYTIPEDITCIQNIYGVHHDPDLWEESEKFNPQRFLDEQSNVNWPPYLMPFSVGPRLCIGQPLAEMKLRLIFSCLLHRFSFTLPEDLLRPTLQPDVGLTMKPFPYHLRVCARDEN